MAILIALLLASAAHAELVSVDARQPIHEAADAIGYHAAEIAKTLADKGLVHASVHEGAFTFTVEGGAIVIRFPLAEAVTASRPIIEEVIVPALQWESERWRDEFRTSVGRDAFETSKAIREGVEKLTLPAYVFAGAGALAAIAFAFALVARGLWRLKQ